MGLARPWNAALRWPAGSPAQAMDRRGLLSSNGQAGGGAAIAQTAGTKVPALPASQRVLDAPLGLVRLMAVLGEQEALRNEALLLLQQLVCSNTELAKMAVFEGAFDRIWAILG